MYQISFTFCYCVFLLVILSSGKNENWKNFTNDDKQSDNLTMSYKFNKNSMRNQDNKIELMRYNLSNNSMKNKSETNFMHKRNANSNEDDDDTIVLYKMHKCNNTCIQHCCSIIINNCYSVRQHEFVINHSNYTQEEMIDYSCKEDGIDIMNNENTMFFDYSLNLSRHDRFISMISTCIDILTLYKGTMCSDVLNEMVSIYINIMKAILIASLLCLLTTFIVYIICPELQNMQGYSLCSYVLSLFVVYVIFLIELGEEFYNIPYPACIAESTVCAKI